MNLAETLKKDREEKLVAVAKAKDPANSNTTVTGDKHSFESFTYTSPHYCTICGKFLWGFDSFLTQADYDLFVFVFCALFLF